MAGQSSLTRTYYDLATSTIENFMDSGKLYDAVFENNAILNKMQEMGSVKIIAGGERLSGGIMDKSNGTITSYSGTDELNVTLQQMSTRWFLSPKLYAVSVGISGDDMTSNRGPEAFVDMLSERMENAAMTIADRVGTDIAEDDGTGNSSKNITGLPAMIKTDPTTGQYAQIDSSVNTKWRNQVDTSVGSVATAGVSALRGLYNDIAKGSLREGGAMPDVAFTTQTVHEAYEALLFPRFRIQDNGGPGGASGNLGNGKVYYKNCELMWDPHITTTGVLYMWCSRFVDLVVYRDRNFEMDPSGLQKPINQDAKIGQIFFKGNLCTKLRNKTGKLTGLT